MATTEELSEIAAYLGEFFDGEVDLLETALDNIVYDKKEEEAAAINNDGNLAQIDYLLGTGITKEEIMDLIEENSHY